MTDWRDWWLREEYGRPDGAVEQNGSPIDDGAVRRADKIRRMPRRRSKRPTAITCNRGETCRVCWCPIVVGEQMVARGSLNGRHFVHLRCWT